MTKFALLLLVFVGCLGGVVLSALRLPGLWLIVFGSLLMGWLTDWVLVSGMVLAWILGLGVLAEALEFLMSAFLTRRAGGSQKAAWGALLGGLVGLLFLSIPLPLFGSILGALLGCFLGAVLGEFSAQGSLGQGTRVGTAAVMGFALGAATKVALTLIVSIIVFWSVAGASWPTIPAQPSP